MSISLALLALLGADLRPLPGLPAEANPNAWPAQVLPEDLPAVQAYAERMADTLEPCELEFRWVSSDSSEFLLGSQSSPLFEMVEF